MSRIIGGAGKGRRLKTAGGDSTRPTGARVRQSLFDILAPLIPGCRFLDAFAGNGGVGLEALSRGAAKVVLVDKAAAAVEAAKENARALDPPYAGDLYEPLLARLGEGPLLAEGGVVVAEHFHKRPLPETIGALTRTRQKRVGDHCLSFYQRTSGAGESEGKAEEGTARE
jgi:16S rRNA G966 N2-methylase RsmD